MGANDIQSEDSWVWTDETPGLHFYLFLGNNFVLKKYIIFFAKFWGFTLLSVAQFRTANPLTLTLGVFGKSII